MELKKNAPNTKANTKEQTKGDKWHILIILRKQETSTMQKNVGAN